MQMCWCESGKSLGWNCHICVFLRQSCHETNSCSWTADKIETNEIVWLKIEKQGLNSVLRHCCCSVPLVCHFYMYKITYLLTWRSWKSKKCRIVCNKVKHCASRIVAAFKHYQVSLAKIAIKKPHFVQKKWGIKTPAAFPKIEVVLEKKKQNSEMPLSVRFLA